MSSGLYILTGVALFGIGLAGALRLNQPLRKLLALNIMGSGILLVFVSLAYRGLAESPDPVPHALVLTGIVVAVAATALGLALMVRIHKAERKIDEQKAGQ